VALRREPGSSRFAAVALIGAALASIFALLIVRRWLQSIRRAVDDIKAGRNGGF
jgi:hypothetical protein